MSRKSVVQLTLVIVYLCVLYNQLMSHKSVIQLTLVIIYLCLLSNQLMSRKSVIQLILTDSYIWRRYIFCLHGGGAVSSSVCLLKRKILLSVIQPRQIHYTCNMLSVLQLRQIHYTCHNYYRFCSLLSNRDKFITLVTIIINLALRYPTEANSLHLRQLL